MPSTLTVTNNLSSGPGSLTSDISAAQSGDTIVFAKGVNGTIVLSGFELYINKNLDIEGPGANKVGESAAAEARGCSRSPPACSSSWLA